MPKVSVIVPCYNVAPYVSACLDSLVNQTLGDIEIICVDDKSTDNTVAIIKERMAQDSHIKLIELPKNSGVSVARNTGIDAATGEYISFVDADDYVDLNYFEKLFEKAQTTGADICVSNIKEYMHDGTIRKHNGYVRRVCRSKHNFSYIQCAAIYRTDFINKNNLRVPVGITNGEDTLFCIKCSVFCNYVSSVPKSYYHYVRRGDSAERQFYSDKQINSRIKVAHAIVDFINSVDVSSADYKAYFARVLNMLLSANISKTTLHDLRKKSVDTALELYSQAKYPDIIKTDDLLYPYLQCNDANGLYQHVARVASLPKKIHINILKKIPVLTIKQTVKDKKIRLFGLTIFYIVYEQD